MIFTSINFLIFFPVVILLFYVTPIKHRWITLLASSYFFYLNIEPVFGLLTAFITICTYIFTRLIDATEDDDKKNRYMYINIFIILMPLFFFKYFNAINESIFLLLESYDIRWTLPQVSFLLPVGISFYTFMAIGYTIDVCNEEIEAEKNIGIVALFISFFPLILSGPIERAQNMIPQFKSELKLNPANFTEGFKLMLWGYFMKLVVADRLSIHIDAVYNNIEQHNGDTLLLTTILYPIQVYADLGGYSLIAIGVSKILGIDVIPNFNRPFLANSMAELWRRWHMSLITWLTDYVYTPIAFNFRKFGTTGVVMALLVTFLISGVWHGANFNYVLWGLLQGAFLSIEAIYNKRKIQFETKHNLNSSVIYLGVSILITYILFAASQVFGRAETVSESLLVFEKIFSERGIIFMAKTDMTYATIGVLMLLLSDFRDEYFQDKIPLFNSKNIFIRFGSYLSVAVIILWIGVLNGGQFIYFQF